MAGALLRHLQNITFCGDSDGAAAAIAGAEMLSSRSTRIEERVDNIFVRVFFFLSCRRSLSATRESADLDLASGTSQIEIHYLAF